MPTPSIGMSRLAEIAAAAVHEHGTDWDRIRLTIEAALAEMPDAERQALDIEIVTNEGLVSPRAGNRGH